MSAFFHRKAPTCDVHPSPSSPRYRSPDIGARPVTIMRFAYAGVRSQLTTCEPTPTAIRGPLSATKD